MVMLVVVESLLVFWGRRSLTDQDHLLALRRSSMSTFGVEVGGLVLYACRVVTGRVGMDLALRRSAAWQFRHRDLDIVEAQTAVS